MATHSVILAWRIQWTEEPCRLWSMGSQRDTTERTHTLMNIINWQLHSLSCHDHSSYHMSRINQKWSRHHVMVWGIIDFSDSDRNEVAVTEEERSEERQVLLRKTRTDQSRY